MVLYFRLVILHSNKYFLMMRRQAPNYEKENKTLNKSRRVLTVVEDRTSNTIHKGTLRYQQCTVFEILGSGLEEN